MFVDEFDLSAASCGHGLSVRAGLSASGTPLTISGQVAARGFGTRPESAVAFVANGRVRSFDAQVGIDANAASIKHYKGRRAKQFPAGARFRVWADGRVVCDSGPVKEGEPAKAVHAELTGAREIVLETQSLAPFCALDASDADWANARFTCDEGCELEVLRDASRFRQLGILTPPECPEPRFNGPDIWGVRPGRPVVFRCPVSGRRPLLFSAEGLPPGMELDAERGILSGTAPKCEGPYDIRVTVENAAGRACRTFRLEVGPRICLTPPMGWNSWNVFSHRLTQASAESAARAMDESGLGDYGYAYVNLDDFWQMNNSGEDRVEDRSRALGREDLVGSARDGFGRILPNRSFADMRAFVDSVHSLGFKAGIYSSPGALTCGGCEGSLGHEAEDAASWAKWGFDLVKYDWCSYQSVFEKETGRRWWNESSWNDVSLRTQFAKPYRVLSDCLARQSRDIVLCVCQYGAAHVDRWAREAGAQTWRSWSDLKDGWTWLEKALDGYTDGSYETSGPGCWADPDMLVVGGQYSFGFDHPTFLTPNEQYTHLSLWAMVAAPLLTGCDLTALDDFTRLLLANGEVIAIDQDRLGAPARRIRHTASESVWVRKLANGDLAVALVNRYPLSRKMRLTKSELNAEGTWLVRDCWSQADKGVLPDEYLDEIPPHATRLLRLRKTDRQERGGFRR